jgi:hypothetical protein
MMKIIKTTRLQRRWKKTKGGEMEVIKMCAKMCEFDGCNQPCTRSYHNITHALM